MKNVFLPEQMSVKDNKTLRKVLKRSRKVYIAQNIKYQLLELSL